MLCASVDVEDTRPYRNQAPSRVHGPEWLHVSTALVPPAETEAADHARFRGRSPSICTSSFPGAAPRAGSPASCGQACLARLARDPPPDRIGPARQRLDALPEHLMHDRARLGDSPRSGGVDCEMMVIVGSRRVSRRADITPCASARAALQVAYRATSAGRSCSRKSPGRTPILVRR